MSRRGGRLRTDRGQHVLAALAALASLASSGCSYALLETARTEAPGTVGGSWGFARVSSELNGQAGRHDGPSTAAQVMMRTGLTDHLDAGLGFLHGSGVQANLKYNLMERTNALAVAPRLGGGFAGRYNVWTAYGGGLVSYSFAGVIEPYLGLTFANHWIGDYPESDVTLGLGERRADRSGTGDGLLQAVIGFQLPADTGLAFIMEYGHWFVMQNDPGDNYAFVPTRVLAVGMRWGRRGALRPKRRPRPKPAEPEIERLEPPVVVRPAPEPGYPVEPTHRHSPGPAPRPPAELPSPEPPPPEPPPPEPPPQGAPLP